MFLPLFTRYPFLFYKGKKRIKSAKKTIYLTFDDGPTSDITFKLLAILDKYNIKATFFCCGKNADKQPEIISTIEQTGHVVGYHSYSHLDICKTKPSLWLKDVERNSLVSNKILFRPPYGRILPQHYLKLKEKYQFVFWDVMSYDYNTRLTPERILLQLDKSVRNGSIIVFHDNIKASKNTLIVLPLFIENMLHKGYKFDVIR